MAEIGKREDLEKDHPKIFDAIHSNGDGTYTGYMRAAASYEDLAKARPIPHDAQMKAITDRYDAQDEARERAEELWREESDSARQQVAEWKEQQKRDAARAITVSDAWLQLRKAAKVWFQVLPCGILGWHTKSVAGKRDGKDIVVCRRCRAWREL